MLRTKVLLAQGFRILSSRPWPELPLPRRSGEELNGPQGQRPGFGPGPVTSDGRTNRNASSARRAACCRLDRKPGWTVTSSAVPIQSLWDQGSLCPDLPIVQEKPKIASPTHLFFLVKFFFIFKLLCSSNKTQLRLSGRLQAASFQLPLCRAGRSWRAHSVSTNHGVTWFLFHLFPRKQALSGSYFFLSTAL